MQLGPEGFSPSEFPIQTLEFRSPDIVWISSEPQKANNQRKCSQYCLKICMNVMSPGN